MLKIRKMVSHKLALLTESVNMKIFDTSERGKDGTSINAFIHVFTLLMRKVVTVEVDAEGKLGAVETLRFPVIR